jgi:hypothetical protein
MIRHQAPYARNTYIRRLRLQRRTTRSLPKAFRTRPTRYVAFQTSRCLRDATNPLRPRRTHPHHIARTPTPSHTHRTRLPSSVDPSLVVRPSGHRHCELSLAPWLSSGTFDIIFHMDSPFPNSSFVVTLCPLLMRRMAHCTGPMLLLDISLLRPISCFRDFAEYFRCHV